MSRSTRINDLHGRAMRLAAKLDRQLPRANPANLNHPSGVPQRSEHRNPSVSDNANNRSHVTILQGIYRRKDEQPPRNVDNNGRAKLQQQPRVLRRVMDTSATSAELKKSQIELAADLRRAHLKPAKLVLDRRVEIRRIECYDEDMNGPYNFRKLLKPAEYLPTETLRKRKGGLVVVPNGNVNVIASHKVGEMMMMMKHVKRRAPCAPAAAVPRPHPHPRPRPPLQTRDVNGGRLA